MTDKTNTPFPSIQDKEDALRKALADFRDLALAAVDLAADTPQAEDIEKTATVALSFISGCDAYWRRLCSYVLNTLDPRDPQVGYQAMRSREEWERIRALAQSIFRTEQAVALRHGIDIYRLSDPDEALERARIELTSLTNPKKETIQ